MRKLLLLPAIFSTILIGLQSCSKQSVSDLRPAAASTDNTINATIASNQAYVLVLDNSGSISLAKQASHFKVSQTEFDSKSGLMVYRYVPAVDYTGSDEVVISKTKTITTESSGACYVNQSNSASENNYTTTSYTTIKINIAN